MLANSALMHPANVTTLQAELKMQFKYVHMPEDTVTELFLEARATLLRSPVLLLRQRKSSHRASVGRDKPSGQMHTQIEPSVCKAQRQHCSSAALGRIGAASKHHGVVAK